MNVCKSIAGDWYTGLLSSRTQARHTYPVSIRRPDMSKAKPEDKLREIEALGDFWTRSIITERELRKLRRSGDI